MCNVPFVPFILQDFVYKTATQILLSHYKLFIHQHNFEIMIHTDCYCSLLCRKPCVISFICLD